VSNNKTGLVSCLIEKPNIENEPSNLISIGRYFLTPDIFDILRCKSIGVGGEIQLADSINLQAENNRVETVHLSCKGFDCVSIQIYVEAIKHKASNHEFDLIYLYKKFVDNIKNGTNNLFVELIPFK
jgi:UTP--glucose-1-phosphate uridylyltransferase